MDAAAKKKKGQNELGVITKRPGNATHFPAPGVRVASTTRLV